MKPNAQLLIDQLKEAFPDRMPRDSVTIEELRYLQGAQAAIEKLEDLWEELKQEKDYVYG